MTGEYLWKIYTIDPSIIKAVDFSSAENLDSPYAVANYLMNNMLQHDEAAFQGFKNRLIGYIGEQKVADVLAQQGQHAIWANASNQELWDLKIDDQLVNVKTVLDISPIKQTAIAHPDVTYLVPEDTYQDIGITNIQPLNGFNYAEINHSLDSTYTQVDGSDAFDAVTQHLPVFSGIAALKERQRLVKSGGDEASINKNISIDFAAKTVGSLTLAKIGGVVGAGLGSLVFIPVIGAIAGAALGAFWGAKKGEAFGKKIKELELQKQKIKLEELLDKFGKKYLLYIPKIKSQLFLTANKHQKALEVFSEQFNTDASKQSWKKKLFIDKNQLLFQELQRIGELSYQAVHTKAEQRAKVFDQIESEQNSKALALVILNNVHLRDFLYVDLIEIKQIYAQKNKTYYERYKLYPDQYPLTPSLKNYKKLYKKIA